MKSNNQFFSVVANFHIKFEKIHPFTDGNGRIGRLLINKILLDFNTSPIVILNKEKSIYYECLSTENI